MASIVIPITSARQLQQQFKEYDRDYYPYGVSVNTNPDALNQYWDTLEKAAASPAG